MYARNYVTHSVDFRHYISVRWKPKATHVREIIQPRFVTVSKMSQKVGQSLPSKEWRVTTS